MIRTIAAKALIARINSCRSEVPSSRATAANAIRLLIKYKVTQREIAKAAGRSLRWVNAMSRFIPGQSASPFGPTTKAERVSHAKQRRAKRRNRARRAAGKGRKTKSDWPSRSLKGRRSRSLLPYDHSAVMDSRTVYPKTVLRVIPNDTPVLKPGTYQCKIGGKILKSDWNGFPVFTLTLEERATCPKTCHHWGSCYGNGMHRAHRMPHGPELERKLAIEVAGLAKKHPRGFAVRLHILGDFYSVGYVELWRKLLERYPALHIWGYTARIDVERDPIASALVTLTQQNWDRGFRMRFSNAPPGFPAPRTKSIEHLYQVVNDATTICPEQVGKTESCSTCAFCWQSKKPIAFIQH
jgi:hypothetical protein